MIVLVDELLATADAAIAAGECTLAAEYQHLEALEQALTLRRRGLTHLADFIEAMKVNRAVLAEARDRTPVIES